MKHPDLVFKNIFLNHVFTHIHIFIYISNLSLFYSHYVLINSLLSKIGFYDIFLLFSVVCSLMKILFILRSPGCVAQARLKKESIILPQPLIDKIKIMSHHVYFKNFKNSLRTQPGLTCTLKGVQDSSIVFFLAFTWAELWILSECKTGYKELTETK